MEHSRSWHSTAKPTYIFPAIDLRPLHEKRRRGKSGILWCCCASEEGVWSVRIRKLILIEPLIYPLFFCWRIWAGESPFSLSSVHSPIASRNHRRDLEERIKGHGECRAFPADRYAAKRFQSIHQKQGREKAADERISPWWKKNCSSLYA